MSLFDKLDIFITENYNHVGFLNSATRLFQAGLTGIFAFSFVVKNNKLLVPTDHFIFIGFWTSNFIMQLFQSACHAAVLLLKTNESKLKKIILTSVFTLAAGITAAAPIIVWHGATKILDSIADWNSIITIALTIIAISRYFQKQIQNTEASAKLRCIEISEKFLGILGFAALIMSFTPISHEVQYVMHWIATGIFAINMLINFVTLVPTAVNAIESCSNQQELLKNITSEDEETTPLIKKNDDTQTCWANFLNILSLENCCRKQSTNYDIQQANA